MSLAKREKYVKSIDSTMCLGWDIAWDIDDVDSDGDGGGDDDDDETSSTDSEFPLQ
jgi:hypothetical protein